MNERSLFIEADDSTTCDGCGRKLEAGEPFLSGIASCCGPSGCNRSLCSACVQYAAESLAVFDETARAVVRGIVQVVVGQALEKLKAEGKLGGTGEAKT